MQNNQKNTSVRALLVSEPTLSDAFETFIYVRLAGKSARTEDFYREKAGVMILEMGVTRPLSSVLGVDLMDWYAEKMKKQDYSAYTLHGFVRSIRCFFRWLKETGVILDNPAHALKLPKLPKCARYGIRDNYARAILEAARENTRDYAILMFLATTGCRAGGLLTLTLDDFDLDADEPICRQVLVSEKGEKTRTVFLTPESLAALAAWLEERPNIDSKAVFLGKKNGQPWKPLGYSGLRLMIERRAKQAGTPPDAKFSAHEWRHRFARRLLQAGMDLARVSQILGHEDVSITVRHYGMFAVKDLHIGYDQYSSCL